MRKPTGNNTHVMLVLLLGLGVVPSAHAALANMQTPEDKVLAKAFSAYMDGDDKAALSYFEEVTRINPRNEAAERGLEKVRLRLRKKDAIAKSQSHKLAVAKMKEGKTFLRSGDQIGAIDAFHAAVDAVPGHKDALAALKSIRAEADRVVKRQNFNPSAWAFARGTMAYLERDWAKSYRIWSERRSLEPANVVLANATARAETNFKRMMIQEQEDFFRRSARAFYEQGYYSQAMASWGKVLELRQDDVEAMQGKLVSHEAVLRLAGKNKTSEVQALLEQGLDYYSNQRWALAMDTFKRIRALDPELTSAQEYITKIEATIAAQPYSPSTAGGNGNWRPEPAVSNNVASVVMPEGVDNFVERRSALESQLKRDPSNIKIQQELDKVTKSQDEESERIYKDGLISYSQGNRGNAMDKWKQVLIINPDHKKAEAALKKARAEEERSVREESPSQ